MALAHPRRALAGVATSLAAACLVVSGSTPALADHVRNQEWWLRALHVPHAWQSSRGKGVTVAVLGTGVDAQTADLVGSVVTGPDYTGSAEVPYSSYWGVSGTASASLIAGHGHGPSGSDGIVGIAPAATILSVRVTLESNDPLLGSPSIAGALPDAIARGIRYAVRHHASIIDLPLDPATTRGAAGAGGSPAERAAVKYALAHQVVLVAPAGDDGAGADAVNYPAAYPGVISVGAFDSGFVKGTFSSHRPYVTLTAPGVNVIAAQPPQSATGAQNPPPAPTPSPHGPYTRVNSTSAASAMVAGIAALIRSQFPQMTPHQVMQALTRATGHHRAGGRRNGSGYGTADASRALVEAARIMEAAGATPAAAPPPPTPPAIRPTGQSFSQMIRNDAGVAGAVFLVLLAAILALGWVQRRRARAARLAEVRAAALPLQPLRPGPPPTDASGFGDGPPAGGRPSTLSARDSAGGMGDWEARPDSAARGEFQSTMFARSMGGTAAGPDGPDDVFGGGAGTAPGSALPARLSALGPGRPVITGTVISGPASGGADPFSSGPGAGAPGAGGAASGGSGTGSGGSGTGSGGSGTGGFGAGGPGAGGFGAGGPGAGGPGGMAKRALGAHRLPTRNPRVSGTPPWEPASRPDGEVPWARTPSPGPVPQSAPPERGQEQDLSVWDVIAEEVWPGGPRTGRAESRTADRPGDEPPSGPGDVEPPRPIYTWNPGAKTDTFPAVRPDA